MGGRKFLFIFGGYSMKGPTSDLLAIDLTQGLWSNVPMKGGPVSTRLDSAITFVGNRLHIFGGRSDFDDPEEERVLRSYSIAEYSSSPCNQEWKWICIDQPYPTTVPDLGFALQVVSIPEMNKILIFPGREGYNKVSLESNIMRICFQLIPGILSSLFISPSQSYGHFQQMITLLHLHPFEYLRMIFLSK